MNKKTKKEDIKSKYEKLQEKLTNTKKNIWQEWNKKIHKEVFSFSEKYKTFLNSAKTEFETVEFIESLVSKKGFKNIENIKNIKAGDKVYWNYKDRSIFVAKIGKKIFNTGLKIVMSHIDTPHLDLKVSPLYEDENMAFFKTHYYGGIKKYQWPTIPLALHGVVYLSNGKKININIGEKKGESQFMITDLLPHLERKEQSNTKGEDLNLLVGSIPVDDKKVSEKVKLAVLEFLYKKYKIKEADLASAELQAVPSTKAVDIGFDKSLIGAYGHDDRSCSFANIKSFIDAKNSDATQVAILIDREEIGSDGASGAKSIIIERFIGKILDKIPKQKSNMKTVYDVFEKSYALSADVTAGVDPDYKDVHDLKNAIRIGYGVGIEKYTGYGGKYSASEASAKYIAKLFQIFNKNKNIKYQISGGLGKIDLGGGGTIAKYMANRGLDIVDVGVPVLNMHAPMEIVSKADLYAAYLTYKEFFEKDF